jgi:hypothetical protein
MLLSVWKQSSWEDPPGCIVRFLVLRLVVRQSAVYNTNRYVTAYEHWATPKDVTGVVLVVEVDVVNDDNKTTMTAVLVRAPNPSAVAFSDTD